MKKLLISIGLTAVVTFSVSAQNFIRQQFLNNSVLYLTNAATYITNVLDNAGNTNLATIIITNTVTGTNYTTNSTITVQTVQPFRDIPLIMNGANASPYITSGGATNSCFEIGVGYAGANATNGFNIVLVPLISGSEPGSASTAPFVEDTTSTPLTLFVTNNTAVSGVWRFGLNTAQYIGDWGFRVQKVYPNVAPSAANSQFCITNISLNGWRP